MIDVLERIASVGVLPVIKIEDLENAVPLAAALRGGGINAIEVTARNDVAFDAIRAIKDAYPDMVVGAGTILNTNLVDQAINAGAEYIVSPGYNPRTVDYCFEKGITIVPGCVTSSEIEIAAAAGLNVVKFFPAEVNGGSAALKLFNGPFPNIKFVPTGGITYDNLDSYLRLNCVAACGGSFMAKGDTIKSKDWQKITADCQRAVEISLGFELAHVGLNHNSSEEALANAEAMNALFRLGIKNGNSSAFCGKAVEFMKKQYYGTNGHIGFYTNSVARAKAWFEANGVPIIEESYRPGQSFYLKDEIGDFAIHVVKR